MTEEKSLMEYLKPSASNKELDSMRLTDQDTRDKRALLAGATPLLVGLLAGNVGDAADIAGNALLNEDQRQLKEDSDLLGYIRKKNLKATSGKPTKMQKISFMDEKGIQRGGYFNPSYGKYYNTEGQEISNPMTYTPLSEEAKTIARNRGRLQSDLTYGKSFGVTEEGRPAVRDIINETIKPIGNVSNLAPKQRQRVSAAQDDYEKLIKDDRDALSSANQFMEMLNVKNPVSDTYAIRLLVRTIEKGRLSDYDVQSITGSAAWYDRFKQLIAKADQGKLSDENRAYLAETGKKVADMIKKKAENKRGSFIRTKKPVVGVDSLHKYIPPVDSVSNQKIIVENDAGERIKIDIQDLGDAIKDGYKVSE